MGTAPTDVVSIWFIVVKNVDDNLYGDGGVSEQRVEQGLSLSGDIMSRLIIIYQRSIKSGRT